MYKVTLLFTPPVSLNHTCVCTTLEIIGFSLEYDDVISGNAIISFLFFFFFNF